MNRKPPKRARPKIRTHIEPAEWHEAESEIEDIQQRIRDAAKEFT